MSKKKQSQNRKKDKIKKNNYTGAIVLSVVVILFLGLFGYQMVNEKSTNISGLPAGTPAPEFMLQSTKGNIALEDFKGKKNVVLYFYEGNS